MSRITFEELLENSESFKSTILAGQEFPVTKNLITSIGHNPESIERQANDVWILVHPRVLGLMKNYLNDKELTGNEKEKAVYYEMNLEKFIDRLLMKRPLSFYKASDTTRLRGDTKKIDASKEWTIVGTESERVPFVLQEYLSYEEMEFSALIEVACPTFFINKGDRKNKGRPGSKGSYEAKGIYIGAVGARFSRPGLMEARHLIEGASLNEKRWAEFYGRSTHETSGWFTGPGTNGMRIHKEAFKIRMRMILEPIIVFSGAQDRKCVLRLVGFGLGCWAVNEVEQAQLMIQVVKEIVGEKSLSLVNEIEFLWFPENVVQTEHFKDHDGHLIRVVQTNGNPADPVPGGELLVATYAWDGNSFPGNEYWLRLIAGSGDSAAASCSTIQQLQNPYINTTIRAEHRLYRK